MKKISWKTTAVTGALLFGCFLLLFPIDYIPGEGYMKLVPLILRIIVMGLLFPLAALLCGMLYNGKLRELFHRASARFGRAVLILTVFLLPLGFAPLLISSAAAAAAPLFGMKTQLAPVLSLAVALITVGFFRIKSECRSLAGIALLCASAVIALLCLLLPHSAAAPVLSASPRNTLEHSVAVFLLISASLFPEAAAKGEHFKDKIKQPAVFSVLTGGVLALVLIILSLSVSISVSTVTGLTTAELLCLVGCPAFVRVLAALLLLFVSGWLCSLVLDSAQQYITALFRKNSSLKYILLAVALLLSLPWLGTALGVTSAFLFAVYPFSGVITVHYGFVHSPEDPRKVVSVKYAAAGALVYSVFMLLYQLFVKLGIDNLLIRGLYMSMLLSGEHLTWAVIAVLLFVVGDTHYRKQQESAEYKRAKEERQRKNG